MRNFFFLLSFLVASLYADELDLSDKVEIFATKFETKDKVVHARDGVIVIYKQEYLSADELHYNIPNKILTLDGKINLLKGAEFRAIGEHVVLNVASDMKEVSPLFLLEQKAGLWMSAATAVVKKDDYHLQSGMISGCDPQNPLWRIYFSSADYNQETKWVQLYNTRLHLYNIPVLYIPYFAYPTDTSRHSGLLLPTFGYSSDEGLFYEQPIYLAPYDEWDLELRPQIRTLRGRGLYSTLRFQDSKFSNGTLDLGYFRESERYSEEKNLANKKHYGAQFQYSNSNWLDDWLGVESSAQSELYADIKWMNDVDFINLSSVMLLNETSVSELSVLNLFYNQGQNYFGAYFKYFLDLRTQSNSHTLQTLPSLHYHHYIESFLDNYVYVSSNVRLKHYYRESGINADEVKVNVPLTFQSSFMDDYLNFSYEFGSNLDIIKLHKNDIPLNEEIYELRGANYRVNNLVELSTSLYKEMDNFNHSIYLGIEYQDTQNILNHNYYNDVDQKCSAGGIFYQEEFCNFDAREDDSAVTSTVFKQFIYDKKSSQQLLYHKLKQSFSLYLNNSVQKELENELELRYLDASFYSESFFDYERGAIKESFNRVAYDNGQLQLSLSNYYADSADDVNVTKNEKYYIFASEYRYNKHYKYFMRYFYDYENKVQKSSELGFLYSKRCWNFGLRYLENLRPILSDDGAANSIDEHYLFVTIELKPIGGSEFNYKLNNTVQRN